MLYLAIDHARKNRRPRIVYRDANELGSITILCVSCEPLLPRRRSPGASERYPLELKTYILRARNALSRLAMGTGDVPSTKSRKARRALNLLLLYDDRLLAALGFPGSRLDYVELAAISTALSSFSVRLHQLCIPRIATVIPALSRDASKHTNRG